MPATRFLAMPAAPARRARRRLPGRSPAALAMLAALALVACTEPPLPPPADLPPLVRTVAVTGTDGASLGLSGTVRARVELPLAFQVAGRIASRSVDAGQAVTAGQVLFELDKRDLEQGVLSAEADLAGAGAALATAAAELKRQRQMQERKFTSAQDLDRAELAWREAGTRREAVLARLAQARNALEYGRLTAPAAGVLIDVTGQPGQVVGAGQAVAALAQNGEREVEVYFPDGVAPPAGGEASLPDGTRLPLLRREVAGAVEAQSRTRRARYTVLDGQQALVLGAVLRAHFKPDAAAAAGFAVPLGALDERGRGPRVWRFAAGRLEPLPVTVVAVDGEQAHIRGPLEPGQRIVSLGTHLLDESMTVRELPR